MRMLRPLAGLTLAAAVVAGMGLEAAHAQRPFRMHDPFYRDESARRAFFDGFAVTAELSYRAPGTLSNTSAPVPVGQGQPVAAASRAAVPNPAGSLGLVFNVDYQLAPQLDFTAVIDAGGSLTGRSAALSWLSLKRYWHNEGTDYALRLAIDPHPSPRPGFGFRQIDLAGVVTAPLSRRVSLDLMGGVRRAHIGYQQALSASALDFVSPDGRDRPGGESALVQSDIVFSQASGEEVHLMIRYNYHFDLARSHYFASVLYEAGNYAIVEQFLSEIGVAPVPEESQSFRAQVVRLRTGVSWHRPSFKVAPFISVPVLTWKRQSKDLLDVQGRQRANLGLRVTLR